MFTKRVSMRESIDPDDVGKASASTGLHSSESILHHDGANWGDAKPFCGDKEDGGVGLTRQLETLGIDAVNDDIEELGGTGRLQYRLGVTAR